MVLLYYTAEVERALLAQMALFMAGEFCAIGLSWTMCKKLCGWRNVIRDTKRFFGDIELASKIREVTSQDAYEWYLIYLERRHLDPVFDFGGQDPIPKQ